jgi:2,4-dienoyl-CoA reductase-like NADH-dependent reductase (Old Yellow Enzyme family)/thioredoxin reductase
MKLFEPYQVGSLNLKNRIVMAPMVMCMAGQDGSVSEHMVNYYTRRAEGGCALVIVEGTSVDPLLDVHNQLRIDDDTFIPGMAGLAKAIKKNDVKAMLQLGHPGKQMPSMGGKKPIAPSDVPDPVFKSQVHVLTVEEIHHLVVLYVQAAVRAMKAGFDGVEIHGAHGYLISSFLSPFDNVRNDEYGGNTQKRAQFAVEIISGIKKELGDFPVFIRISAEQFTDGIHLDEAKKSVYFLENAGADAIHVSAGRYATIQWLVQPMTQPQGCLIPITSEIKRVARTPVIAVGRIGTPQLAEQILQNGNADLIALGRPLLADPDYPKKAFSGASAQIKPCIGCNTCFDIVFKLQPYRCAVNPEVRQGQKTTLIPVKKAKKVAIIGGGPAGMEAAVSLATRGHKVLLFEKADRLGGQLLLAMAVPGKNETFGNLINYYSSEIKRLGVILKLNTEMNEAGLLKEKPDALIIASGAVPYYPEIPGINGPNVVTAHDVLAGKADTGKRVVVIGGSLTGCETALLLAKHGKSVTVLRRGRSMAAEAGWSMRRLLMEELKNLNVNLLTQVDYKNISGKGVEVVINSTTQVLPADTVVIATGLKPLNDLVAKVEGKIQPVFVIGDCKEPRDAADAIEEGRMAAVQI